MVKRLASPLFLALALINAREPAFICAIPGPFSFLGSMWFMYLVMAVVHSESWVIWLRAWIARGR